MIALLLAALLASTLATDAGFRALRRLARKKPVVRLSPRAFAEYIDSGPKNYSTVIELTSTGHSFPCAECRPAHDEFELAAESYLAQVGGVDSAEFLAEPIFFATIDYSEATLEIFRRFQLSSVPFHAIVPAGSDTQLVLKRGFTSPSVRTADDVAKFVALRLKFDLRVARPLGPVIARSAGMVVGGYLLVFKALPAFYRNPFNPMIAFALSLAVFFLSMSGLVYNLIRTPAFSGVSREGKIEYVMAGSRSQYVAEGLIVATFIVLSVLCHIGVNEVAGSRAPPMVSRAAYYVLLALYIYAINTIWAMFLKKYSFYFNQTHLPWAVPSFLNL